MPKDERESQCTTWDITIPADRITVCDLRKHFVAHCAKYTFQLEQGATTGYRHYQCRVRLKQKARKSTLINSCFCTDIPGCHLSVTSSANRDNDFYVLKEDTKLEGPWTDKDKPNLRTVDKMESNGLYPWQQTLIDETNDYNDRKIHILIDRQGNIGKSALCKYLYMKKDAVIVPPLMDEKDLMQYVMSFPPAKLYIIDMPRAMKKSKLNRLYSGIEQLKNGMMYDLRDHGKFRYIDEPNISVFTNQPPKMSYLSRDRWDLVTVVNNQIEEFQFDDQ